MLTPPRSTTFAAMPQMRMPRTPYRKQFDAIEARFPRREIVRQISRAVLKMRFETKMIQQDVATGIRTSQVVISRMERQVTVWPRFDALECIAHNLRYELLLDGPAGIRVKKKKSWRPKKRDPNEAGR